MDAHEFLERDNETCVACCKDIFKNALANAILITSHEAHFCLSSFVNKQNFRCWSESNPRELHKRLLHSERVIVWCAVANFGVWGPYFFEEEEKAVSVTSACYVQMLQNFLMPKLKNLREMQRYGFNKMEQLPIWQKNQWMFCEDSFQRI